MGGSGTIYGRVVCKSFVADGAALVKYDPNNIGSIPFNFKSSSTSNTTPNNLLSGQPLREVK